MVHEFDTLPQAAERNLRLADAPKAFNQRVNGDWVSLRSSEFLQLARRIALGLNTLGLRPGQTVGIIAKPSPTWLAADMGILMAGGVSVPLFDNISDEALAYEIEDSAIQFIMADGPECVARAQTFRHLLTALVARGIDASSPDQSISFDQLVAEGAKLDEATPDLIAELIANRQATDLATIIYTSGSTGRPKGVEISHRNLISQIEGSGIRFPLLQDRDRAVSCLPLAHVFERMVVYYYLMSGIDLYFVDDIKQVGAVLKEVRPTTMTMVPRLLEKLYLKFEDKADASPWPSRTIANWAIRRALRKGVGRDKSLFDRLADRLVYRKFRDGLGGNLQRVIVGGAALAPHLHRFFLNIGVPIYNGYGLTETSPVLAVNYPGHNQVGSVGPAFPGVELRIAENQEILAKGPNIMLGYHNRPDATAQCIDADGWLHTGDLGRIDDNGFLIISGRVKELLKTSNGKYVSPVPIEQALAVCPYIDMAMVIAEGRTFATCLLFLDPAKAKAVGEAQLKAALSAHIDKVNTKLNQWEQIRDFRFVAEIPTVESGELTPTLKLRRHIILESKSAAIESMYDGHSSVADVEAASNALNS